MTSTLDVKLNRIDRIFHPHETVQGQVIISSPKGFSHQGLAMKVQGSVRLQLSTTKPSGSSDSLPKNTDPMELVYFHLPVAPAGKIPAGLSTFPFEFELQGNDGQELLETYHGIYVFVKYEIVCDCVRGIMKNKLHKTLEFVVEVPLKEALLDSPEEFSITPESLENARPQSLSAMPHFHITGKLHRTNCPVNLPFTGEIIIEEATSPIKSVEIQLIRVESVAHAGGVARDATEIQNVQIGWGDVCRQISIPIYMIFPRLFTCPTMRTPAFKVEFETNVVVLFENGNMITKNFPIVLYR